MNIIHYDPISNWHQEKYIPFDICMYVHWNEIWASPSRRNNANTKTKNIFFNAVWTQARVCCSFIFGAKRRFEFKWGLFLFSFGLPLFSHLVHLHTNISAFFPTRLKSIYIMIHKKIISIPFKYKTPSHVSCNEC